MSSSLSSRKRRISNIETPVRRSKRVKQQSDAVLGLKEGKTILLSSPTDVSDAVVMRQVRSKQAKASGLVSLDTKLEETSEAEAEGALTPRPSPSVHRRTVQRPPLSRRPVGLNRARFGVGIVRCRNWRSSEEDTETEDEGPECSLLPNGAIPIEPTSCGCSGPVDEKLEDQVSAFVLPIDPTQTCFNSKDLWQLRSPSPEE